MFIVHYRYHPYKIDQRHELLPGDYAQRLEHCQIVVNQTDDDLFTWLTSDEAGFELHGKVNSQNVRRWATLSRKSRRSAQNSWCSVDCGRTAPLDLSSGELPTPLMDRCTTVSSNIMYCRRYELSMEETWTSE